MPKSKGRKQKHANRSGYGPSRNPAITQAGLGYPVTPVWLGTRDDPNAGLVPSASGDTGYQDRFDPASGHWYAWAEALWGRCHLGGTTFCYQAIPAELTPFYLELTEFNGLNFGTGNAQIDLDSDVPAGSADQPAMKGVRTCRGAR